MDSHPAPLPDWHAWLHANLARFLLFARSQTRGEADAQDLLQTVLVETWRRGPDHPPADTLVFRTLRRRAVDLARRTDRRIRREQSAPEWWQLPANPPDPGLDAALEHAVRNLPPPLREVVVLKTWGGLTFRQIGEVLGIPLPTAASRYQSALNQLRQALEKVRP